MGSGTALFSLVAEATAPAGPDKYRPGNRYELIILVQESSSQAAQSVARDAMEQARWQYPEFRRITQIPGRMTLEKLRQLNRQKGVGAAIRHGKAIIVFPDVE